MLPCLYVRMFTSVGRSGFEALFLMFRYATDKFRGEYGDLLIACTPINSEMRACCSSPRVFLA